MEGEGVKAEPDVVFKVLDLDDIAIKVTCPLFSLSAVAVQ